MYNYKNTRKSMKVLFYLLSFCLFLQASSLDGSWEERQRGVDGLLSLSSKNTRVLIQKSLDKLEAKKYYENNLLLKNLWLNFILVQSSKLVFLINLEKNIFHVNYTYKSLDKQALALMKCKELRNYIVLKNKKFYFSSSVRAKITRPFLALKQQVFACKKVDKKRFVNDLHFKKCQKDLKLKVDAAYQKLKDFARGHINANFTYNPSYEEYFKKELRQDFF